VYQILIPLIGVFVGLAMLFLLSLIVAPYRHRREARSHIATLQAEIAEVRKERDEAQSRLFAMPDELVAQTLRGLSIRIADLARESDIIRRKTFVDCHIYGPALIYPANSIVVHCQFDGGLEDTFVTTTNDAVVGAIRLEDCTVRECSLHRIGFIGSPEEIKKAKENAQSP